MEKKAGEMQTYVGVFKHQWFEYLSQMQKFQGTLDTLNTHFVKLVSTRKNQLEKPMEKILELISLLATLMEILTLKSK